MWCAHIDLHMLLLNSNATFSSSVDDKLFISIFELREDNIHIKVYKKEEQ